MGTRTWWSENCEHCRGKNTIEAYDAPSCLQWFKKCDKCGWSDDRDYYEISENEIALLTEQELGELKNKDPKVKRFREELQRLEEKK